MSDEVQLIKDKIDVAELVGEYVQLKPAGVNKKGLCPFHHEKTPSFMVSPERGSWHCFGCGKGGDIFTFVQEMEGMEFREALKYLADRAGVILTSYKSDIDSSQRNRIKDINTEAARFFYNFLIKMATAKPAMDYLLKRGLKTETIDEWQIGFVPEQWDLLTQYLLKKGFAIDDLVASGLTIKRDQNSETNSGYASRSFWDRFRGRIMFPIWNVHDEVVGFTGRLLVERADAGKYVNTPQTIVYDKSRIIFGLNKARQEIKAKNLIVMVEGQMDVIACHQAGMKNVVASSGTALTEEQVKLLKRYSSNINMAFDADEAGQNAAKRGIDIAVAEGMNVRVIKIPEGAGKDPDECLKTNPQVWFQSVEKAQNIMEWYLEKVLHGRDLKNPRQKQEVVNNYLAEIALIPYAVERDHWLQVLGERIGVEVSVLREDLPKVKSEKLKVKSNSGQVASDKLQAFSVQKGRFELLVERLLSLFLKFPALATEEVDNLSKILVNTNYLELYNKIKEGYNNDNNLEIEKLRNLTAKNGEASENLIDVLSLQAEWEFSAISEGEAKKEWSMIYELLIGEWTKKRRKELQIEIEQAEKAGDTLKVKLLLQKFGELK